MIRLLDHRADGDLMAAVGAARVGGQPVVSARIATQYVAYAGLRGTFDAPRFYHAGAGALLSVWNGVLTVDGTGFDPVELWEFARFSGCERAICDGETAAHLLTAPAVVRGRLTQHSLVQRPALRFDQPLPAPDSAIWDSVRLEDVFALLKSAFENMQEVEFVGWYADVFLKQRRGLAYTATLSDGKGICSTAAVCYAAPGVAVIGSVATRPDCRGQGLAGRLVLGLVARAGRENQAAYIVSQTDTANRLYERLGFVRVGTYCELGIGRAERVEK